MKKKHSFESSQTADNPLSDAQLHILTKKRKRKRKKILRCCIGIGLVLCLGACTGYYYLVFQKRTESTDIVVTAGANEEILLAQVDSISGNEITYTLVEEVDLSSMISDQMNSRIDMGGSTDENRTAISSDQRGGMMDSGTDKSTAGSTSDQMGSMMPPGGFDGTDTDTVSADGEVTSSDTRGGGGPSGTMGGFSAAGDSDSSDQEMESITSYQLLDETTTTLIPVGTVVTTKLGTETTFSRLAAGDIVKLVVNTTADNEIDAIYIID